MMTPRDASSVIAGAACKYISEVGRIPRSWLAYYVQYNLHDDQIMLRIDCMELTFSTRLNIPVNSLPVIEKLESEIHDFMMLLWGEPK